MRAMTENNQETLVLEATNIFASLLSQSLDNSSKNLIWEARNTDHRRVLSAFLFGSWIQITFLQLQLQHSYTMLYIHIYRYIHIHIYIYTYIAVCSKFPVSQLLQKLLGPSSRSSSWPEALGQFISFADSPISPTEKAAPSRQPKWQLISGKLTVCYGKIHHF